DRVIVSRRHQIKKSVKEVGVLFLRFYKKHRVDAAPVAVELSDAHVDAESGSGRCCGETYKHACKQSFHGFPPVEKSAATWQASYGPRNGDSGLGGGHGESTRLDAF